VRKKIAISAFAALLVLLAGTSWAQGTTQCASEGTANVLAPWYCSQVNQAVAGTWEAWAPLAFITITLAFLIAATIFMAGAAMRNDKVRNFGVGEMYEAAATALIAILFLTLAAVLFGIVPAFVTGPINPYDTALRYISNTAGSTQLVVRNLYDILIISLYYTTVNLSVSSFGFGSSIFNALAPAIALLFALPAEAVGKLLVDGLMALSMEFYLLEFFMYLAIPVFLVPGIILRAIFPLRGLGGMLIAVAISFYLVLPLLFSVAYYFTNTGVIGALDASAAALSVHGAGTLAETNAASPTAPLVTDVKGLESGMGAYFLAVIVYPGLILALTYVAMTQIAEFIGGVSKMSGKMRLL
jgi:hypothetical protein